MRSSIVMFASMLALFFSCQMSRGAEQGIWRATAAAIETLPAISHNVQILRP